MRIMTRQLAFGVFAFVLTAGCDHDHDKECEITCADGFHITTEDECDQFVLNDLAKDHGGSCTGEEHHD